MAEQLRLHQLVGDRGAVDRDVRPARAPTSGAASARHHLLAGARLAGDQHRHARARRPPHLREHRAAAAALSAIDPGRGAAAACGADSSREARPARPRRRIGASSDADVVGPARDRLGARAGGDSARRTPRSRARRPAPRAGARARPACARRATPRRRAASRRRRPAAAPRQAAASPPGAATSPARGRHCRNLFTVRSHSNAMTGLPIALRGRRIRGASRAPLRAGRPLRMRRLAMTASSRERRPAMPTLPCSRSAPGLLGRRWPLARALVLVGGVRDHRRERVRPGHQALRPRRCRRDGSSRSTARPATRPACCRPAGTSACGAGSTRSSTVPLVVVPPGRDRPRRRRRRRGRSRRAHPRPRGRVRQLPGRGGVPAQRRRARPPDRASSPRARYRINPALFQVVTAAQRGAASASRPSDLHVCADAARPGRHRDRARRPPHPRRRPRRPGGRRATTASSAARRSSTPAAAAACRRRCCCPARGT